MQTMLHALLLMQVTGQTIKIISTAITLQFLVMKLAARTWALPLN
jgi:hypothetical protein